MKTTIRRWGNSLAIRIPKLFAVEIGLEPGKELEIDVLKNSLVLTPSQENLDEILHRVTEENIHSETLTSETTGNEVW